EYYCWLYYGGPGLF
nr:immunoglobulin light chain junction region [Macaca mulatta]